MIHGKRQVGAALSALALALVVNAPARAADATPSPAAAQSARVATSMVYKAALANRKITIQAINEAFTKAVKRAKKDFSAAVAKATTPSQKSAAAAKFRDAINKATAIRQAALDSLPELPPTATAKAAAKAAAR